MRNTMQNKRMNNDVYKLRRQVINIIYRVKRLVPDLPRIEVRVCEDHEKYAGVAIMGKRQIFISESFVASVPVVLHEILHAVYGQEHVEGCPLMDRYCASTDERIAFDLFVMYARRYQL